MGLFDNIMKKAEEAGEAVKQAGEAFKVAAEHARQEAEKQAGAGANTNASNNSASGQGNVSGNRKTQGISNAGNNNSSGVKKPNVKQATSTPLDPTKRIEVKFGNGNMYYVDKDLQITLALKGFGTAHIAVKDMSAFKDEEDMIEKARGLCIDLLAKMVSDYSGRMSYDYVMPFREEYVMNAKGLLEDNGMAAMVDLMALVLEEESQKLVDDIEAAKNNAVPVQVPDTEAGISASMASSSPKFCPNCGSTVESGKFCTNCGAKL